MVRGAVDGGVEEVDNVGLEAEEDGFGLRIAEAGVELEDHGTARGHHDAAEEDAFEGVAFGAHSVDYFLCDVAEKPLTHGGGGNAVSGVGAHAAGVRAGVAFADALVVLGRGDLDGVRAITEGEEGEFFAGEELFEDDFGFGGSEKGAAQHLGCCLFGFEMRVADDDTFTGGKSGGFDDDGNAESGEFSADFIETGAEGICGGGDVVALHELFGEGFAGFELRGVLCGAEDSVTAPGELVDEADGEGEFRADDC